MVDEEEKSASSDIQFHDSDRHVWADLTALKNKGKITLVLLDGTEYTFSEPEMLIGMDSPELKIELDERKIEDVEYAESV